MESGILGQCLSACVVKASGSEYACVCVFAYVFATDDVHTHLRYNSIWLHGRKVYVRLCVYVCWPLIND